MLLWVSVAAVFLGCGPSALDLGPTVPTIVRVGQAQRSFVRLTDLDEVRDVAVSARELFVATDHGLLVYDRGDAEVVTRLTAQDGLGSDDATALAGRGPTMFIASSAGLFEYEEGEIERFDPQPPRGHVRALIAAGDILWACTDRGLLRFSDERWVRFGELASCTSLAGTPEGHLWVGTTQGLWYVEGEVIAEHAFNDRLIEGTVRSIVPVRPGQAFVLVQGRDGSSLGFFDGNRWFEYTLEGLGLPAVGLVHHETDVVLIVADHALAIRPGGAGAPLVALRKSEPDVVRSYRARLTTTAEGSPPSGAATVSDPTRFAAVPSSHSTIDAPSFSAQPLAAAVPGGVYWARTVGETLYVADRNRGVAALRGQQAQRFQSRDLVTEDLQIAAVGDDTYLLGRAGTLAKFNDGVARQVAAPEGVLPQALAEGPHGVYLLGLAAERGPSGSAVAVYRRDSDRWVPVLQRTLALPTALESVSFLGVAEDETVWAGLRVAREDAEGSRLRGVAVLSPSDDGTVFHHRAAVPATDGVGALQMPDEVTSVDLRQEGYAWFPSLSGVVRVGNHQAIVFGESRGVRGEFVTDVAVGTQDRVWLAAAEGVGVYADREFDFNFPPVVQHARPTALAVDRRGHVWGAGARGATHFDGTQWVELTAGNGLPPLTDVRDVEIGAHDSVWLLTAEEILVF